MVASWVTPADVALWANTSESDQPNLAAAVDAAAAWVERKRDDLPWTPPGDPVPFVPGADVLLGTCMLAWRWYQRHATPGGIPGLPDGGALLVDDPDIARLLGIGRGGPFVFGAGRRPVEPVTP